MKKRIDACIIPSTEISTGKLIFPAILSVISGLTMVFMKRRLLLGSVAFLTAVFSVLHALQAQPESNLVASTNINIVEFQELKDAFTKANASLDENRKKQLIALLQHFLLNLYEEEHVQPESKPEPVKSININTPQYQKLKDAFSKAQASLEQDRKKQLTELLKQFLSKSDAMFQEKKRLGNIKGVAIARKAKIIFEEALAEVEEKQDFDLPENVRKELEAMMEECKKQKKDIKEQHKKAVVSLEEKFMTEFAKISRRLPGQDAEADQESLRKKFEELVSKEAPVPTPPEGVTNVVDSGKAVVSEPSPFIANSGTANQWVTVAQWTTKIWGMDVFTIPVLNRKTNTEIRHPNPVVGEASVSKFKVIHTLPERGDYVFRLKRIPGTGTVEVVEWPDSKNKWALVVRTPHPLEAPSEYGFELEAGLPGNAISEVLFAAERADSGGTNGPPVKIAMSTRPAGALIHVDGGLYKDDNGAIKTPCIIELSPGKHTICFSMYGYLDKVFKDYELKADQKISWVFQKDPTITTKVLSVAARSSWSSTGIEIKKGTQVTVLAEGTWKCGSKKEDCDPNGYPNDERFYHYYLTEGASLRQVKTSNYGALLMKIGKDGAPAPVGKKLSLVAKKEGILFLDINEAADKDARQDNSGQLKVSISVKSQS